MQFAEAEIPQAVKDAMELHNFNNEGHPLTARRIMFVKVEVDRIIDDARAFNNWVVGGVMEGALHDLPQDIQNSLQAVVDVSDFFFYAIADGLRTLFSRHGRWNGLDGPDKEQEEPCQMILAL